MDTKLKQDLLNSANKAKYDEHVKRILSNRKILARILHRVVRELADLSLEEIEQAICGDVIIGGSVLPDGIVSRQQEDPVPGENTIYFDLRFTIYRKDQELKIQFDLEAQKSYYPGYEIVTRGVFYCSRMLSAQVDTEFTIPHYDDLQKVYSIWLCFHAPKKVGNAIIRYRMCKEDILGHVDVPEAAYDKLEIIQICLREDAYQQEDEMIGLLNTIFSEEKSFSEIANSLENDYNISMDNGLGKEVLGMCNLSDLVEERGIQKGIQQGIQQEKEASYSSYCKLINQGTPLDTILSVLEDPDDFQKWYAKQSQ